MSFFNYRYFPDSHTSEEWFHSSLLEMSEHWEVFLQTVNSPQVGFFNLADSSQLLESCEKLHENFAHKKCFVQVGIGGSHLGAEMLVEALGKEQTHGTRFLFINNIDPDKISQQLITLVPSETLFYFVSKSGGTAETMAVWTLVVEWFKDKGISPSELHQFMVFATDPNNGDLRKLAKNFGIDALDIPENIGGRFSVLSPVGLFPALFAGINVRSLLEGAREYKSRILSQEMRENELVKFCSFLNFLKKEKIDQTVFMPYSARLHHLSFWFVQLWAESLGKKFNRKGEAVYEGPTPIAAMGATDQHSLLQLLVEGPKNKCVVFIEIEQFDYDFDLANTWNDFSSLKKLSNLKLSELFKAELEGTIAALTEVNRPHVTLSLHSLNERNLGALILMLESLTVLMGICLNVDPFDQPGVETSKIYAFQWASKIKNMIVAERS